MSALVQTKHYITPEEYLMFEREALDQRHEYFDGEIFAMSGASFRHTLISSAITGIFYNQLHGRNCSAVSSDLRVKIPDTGLYTYPDIVVVCGEPEFEDQVFDTLLNPVVIIEILSKSTENYDRGKKFENYRKIKSLQEYLLISQEEIHIEHYQRQDNNVWTFKEYTLPEEKIILSSINAQLVLADIYAKITF
jgi:Uma2 family endonuclease